jgi:hypothetical protein
MINDKSQLKSPIEQLFDQMFSEPAHNAKKEQMKHAAQEGAEALWNMYVAFREAGFSESQAMYFCGEFLTSQGGE